MFLSYLIFIFLAVAVLSAILYLPFYFVQRKKYGKSPFSISPGYHLCNLIPFVWVKQNYAMGYEKRM